MRYLIGIDESGRGPLAGPLMVGAVMVGREFDIRKAFPDARDSKVMSAAKREAVYADVLTRAKAGELTFCVRVASAASIDTYGISEMTRRAVYDAVCALAPEPAGVRVLLDGLLHAPSEYSQETIIHGDSIEPLISLASIVAKVRRDRMLVRFSKKYPEYGLEVHKGYGTLAHRRAIEKHGLTPLHRRSFCKALILAKESV